MTLDTSSNDAYIRVHEGKAGKHLLSKQCLKRQKALYNELPLTVMAQIVSVLMDSVSVLRMGETAERKNTKSTAGLA